MICKQIMLCLCMHIMCAVCIVQYIGAFYFPLQAREEEGRGEHDAALRHARIALYLNIAAVVFWIVVWIIWIAAVAAG